MKMKLAIAVATVILVSSCNRPPEQNDTSDSTGAAPAGPVQVAEAPTEAYPQAVLTADPNPVNLCSSKTTSVTVSWDLTATPVRDFGIWVQQGKQEPKLWFSSRNLKGSKNTGNYVRGGTKIFIRSPRNPLVKALAIEAIKCDQEGPTESR